MDNLICQITLNYSILWIVVIWNFVAYRRIYKEFAKGAGITKDWVNLIRRMKFYPWSLVVCYTPLSIFLCLKGVNVDVNDYLFGICLFFARCFGLANSLIYGFTENLKKKMLLGLRNQNDKLISNRF